MAGWHTVRVLHYVPEMTDVARRRGGILFVFGRTAISLALALIIAATSVSPASASPAERTREEARRVKQQVDALDVEFELAVESFNEARIAHETLLTEIRETNSRIAEKTAVIGDMQRRLGMRVETMYRTGPLGFVEVLLEAEDFRDFASTWDLLVEMNERDSVNVQRLVEARKDLEAAQALLEEQEEAARAARDEMASNRAAIERKLADRRRMLAGLEAEIAAIEAAERARAEAAARAAGPRGMFAVRERGSFPPPTRAPRSEVVNIAKRYLGAPYRWGASGPSAFDCSGFTLFVFRQVGVRLPHSSRAQFGIGERVSRADLKPGDLVFFGSPIRHVGIYVGGGRYIHSPRTGDVVKISSLGVRRDYVGATRP